MNEYHKFQVELAKRLITPRSSERLVAAENSNAASDSSKLLSVESISVESLCADQLSCSSETLVRKRISQTRYWLPKTSRYLGDRFAIAFREFATQTRRGAGDSRSDAIEFANHLRKCHRNLPNWIADLAVWESLQCYRCRGPFVARGILLRYDVASWLPFGPKLPRFEYRWVCVLRWGRWCYVPQVD